MRKRTVLTRASWIVDPESVDRNNGRQVNWDYVSNAFRATAVTITLTAAALINATSIATAALPIALSKGTTLNFGGGKTATIAVGAPIGATTVQTEALPVALLISDTTIVGGAGGKIIKSGAAMVELSDGKVIPRSVTVSGAAVAATAGNTGNGTFTLATLPATAIRGVYKVRINRAAANAGDFMVEDPAGRVVGYGTVGVAFSNQIAFTLADGATDFVLGDSWSVTVAGTPAGNAAGLILSDANEGDPSEAKTGYGMALSGIVFENLLPDATGSPKVLPQAVKDELNANGLNFRFETYVDSLAA